MRYRIFKLGVSPALTIGSQKKFEDYLTAEKEVVKLKKINREQEFIILKMY